MKEYILNLDRPRKLVYDYDAIEKIREHYKIEGDAQDVLSNLKLDASTLPSLVNIGLLWEDPNLAEIDTKRLLNESIRNGTYAIIDHLEIVTKAIVYQQTGKEVSIKKNLDDKDFEKAGIKIESEDKESENLASSPQNQPSEKTEK